LTLLGISETFTKEIMKQVVLKALPKLEEAQIQKIFDEIDDMALDTETAEKEPRFGFDTDAQS